MSATACVAIFMLLPTTFVEAASLSEAELLYRTGKYEDCIKLTAEETTGGAFRSGWWELKIRSEIAIGDYESATQTVEAALKDFPSSLALRILGHDVHRAIGNQDQAEALLQEIEARLGQSPERASRSERVPAARFFLLRGIDAKKVLEQFLDPAMRGSPDDPDAFLTAAELALNKYDGALAADLLRKAPKSAQDDPRYHFLMARAFANSDREKSLESIEAALKINPRHVESMLLRADQLISSDRFEDTENLLEEVVKVDPLEPRAWAYRAVLANLKADAKAEEEARTKALTRWSKNPEVDYLIGKKLAQDYRFAEGAGYQRKSLTMEATYLPAKLELCQALLRLGEEDEGWKLADEIFTKDAYNVVAYNLVTLRDSLERFVTIEGEGFALRMAPNEAALYGQRALALLQRARQELCEKYDVTIDGVIVVEIFPKQQDFAVRTFGLPGAEGFLGVCFGRVITANSPASRPQSPSNWEAVLWHEFCHTVTLHKTRNKMPRWLSEGISVYEELQENPGWGQWLTPVYREMMLGEDLTPLSKLTSAFMAPKSAMHLQFAYFESALAVEFLVDRFGFSALKAVLDDLGAGLPINEALVRRTTALAKLDKDFEEFAKKRATETAAKATWEQPELPPTADSEGVKEFLKEHPSSFWALQQLGIALIREKKWEEAEKTIKELQSLYPEYTGSDDAYGLLSAVYRGMEKPDEERKALEELARRDGDSVGAFERLIGVCRNQKDWEGVAANAHRWLAVNPLIPAPHRALAEAAEQTKNPGDAIAAYTAMLELGDPDLAKIHYRLAVLHKDQGEMAKSRRHVLMALEEAPRFRDGHRLLLELVNEEGTKP